ncbi:MAG: hypothetical protein ACPGJV_15350 [Bacteriovoracaceae bacterium]
MTTVSGFTFVKNGMSLGYPIAESLKSVEPLCDEVVINVCFDDEACAQDDGTYEYLRDTLNTEKYKFLKSYWKGNKDLGDHIYGAHTNYALNHCKGKVCQYIQGDEVLHEKDYPEIEKGFKELIDRNDLHGLLFHYYHFYGNVDAYKFTRQIYKREIRTIKNNIDVSSWKDAQGFRFKNETKLRAKQIPAHIYHYGWARKESIMKEKVKVMATHYHGDDFVAKEEFEYKRIWGVKAFEGTHPKVMGDWVEANRNEIDMMSLPRAYHSGDINLMVTDLLEWLTGYRLGEYKNFKVVK